MTTPYTAATFPTSGVGSVTTHFTSEQREMMRCYYDYRDSVIQPAFARQWSYPDEFDGVVEYGYNKGANPNRFDALYEVWVFVRAALVVYSLSALFIIAGSPDVAMGLFVLGLIFAMTIPMSALFVWSRESQRDASTYRNNLTNPIEDEVVSYFNNQRYQQQFEVM